MHTTRTRPVAVPPPASPPPSCGRPLSPAQLSDVVTLYADEVRHGAFVPAFQPGDRWHARIYQDDQVDVWLITWTEEQGTELHDHGGSGGAFTVVQGELTEYVWRGGGPEATGALVSEVRREGDSLAFGPDYVHDVRNHRVAPAVSVHAYSPPIRTMHFYEVEAGRLQQWAQSWTDDPETPAPHREAS